MKYLFSTALYSREIIDRFNDLKAEKYNGIVYRAVFHESNIELDKTDFYPSIMQHNKNTMPSFLEQDVVEKIDEFSTSLNSDLQQLKEIVKSMNSLRKNTKCYCAGYINEEKGINTSPDKRCHISYFLFDPINKSPVDDFKYVDGDE